MAANGVATSIRRLTRATTTKQFILTGETLCPQICFIVRGGGGLGGTFLREQAEKLANQSDWIASDRRAADQIRSRIRFRTTTTTLVERPDESGGGGTMLAWHHKEAARLMSTCVSEEETSATNCRRPSREREKSTRLGYKHTTSRSERLDEQ